MKHRREPKRARRIRDKQRMKRYARYVAQIGWGWGRVGHVDLAIAEKSADHLKVCSCWMCGHQRKWHGMNMQEIRERARLDLALVTELNVYEEYEPGECFT